MKKKKVQSGEELPGQQSADYVVGQVSGSLFQKPSGSGSLSALFSTAASPAAPLLFQPPPPRVETNPATNQQQEEIPEGKGQVGQKTTKKKKQQVKSDAEQQVEDRESGLLKADEDERGQERSAAMLKKRKRKMQEEAAEMGAEHWVMKRRKLKARKEEEAEKSKRTVFVGNLPAGCTKKTLQSLFRGSGSIESIRFRSVVREDPSMSRKVAVIQRKVHPKKTNMNAYVVFREEEGAVGALQRNGLEIQKDFFIRVDRVNQEAAHDHKRSVFVGNLSFEIGESSFRRHFHDCGAVEAVRLVRDANSGLGKGFGYVLFESADSVQLALELDGTKLEGRSIRVKRSVKKEKQKTKTDGGGGGGGRRMVKEGGRGGGGRGGGAAFTPQSKFSGKHQKSSSSFKGEMVDPKKKTQNKKKGLKKKSKPKKSVHI